jgi:membrane protease YdiL (CAAX protease family)
MEPETSSGSSKVQNLRVAFLVVIATMAGEYFFRHFVMFWFPTIGDPRVNDMIALLVAYSLLTFICGQALRTQWKQELSGLGLSLRELLMTWDYVPWVVLIGLSSVLALVDQFLWGNARLMQWFTGSFHDSTIWFVAQAPTLKAIALVSVNGLFVPVAEEFLWRGIVQARLVRILPVPAAIGITAVLFSFKHVFVDDSFGRFLFIVAFGVICGIVAQRKSWQASAAVHMFANTVASILALVMGTV